MSRDLVPIPNNTPYPVAVMNDLIVLAPGLLGLGLFPLRLLSFRLGFVRLGFLMTPTLLFVPLIAPRTISAPLGLLPCRNLSIGLAITAASAVTRSAGSAGLVSSGVFRRHELL
jgi:hypothetical protein